MSAYDEGGHVASCLAFGGIALIVVVLAAPRPESCVTASSMVQMQDSMIPAYHWLDAGRRLHVGVPLLMIGCTWGDDSDKMV